MGLLILKTGQYQCIICWTAIALSGPSCSIDAGSRLNNPAYNCSLMIRIILILFKFYVLPNVWHFYIIIIDIYNDACKKRFRPFYKNRKRIKDRRNYINQKYIVYFVFIAPSYPLVIPTHNYIIRMTLNAVESCPKESKLGAELLGICPARILSQ